MSGTQIADDPANAQNPASVAQRPPAPPGEAEFEVPGRAWPAAWPVAPGRARTGGARARRAAELLIAALLLAGVVLAAVYVIRGAFFTDPTAFPAVLEPPSMTYLQFSNEGQITGVSVQPGQTIRAGQVLASQSTTLLQLRLSYDQASLNADQANLTALPAKQTAQQQDLDLAVTVAQKELSAAEAQLAAARTPQEQAAASAAISAAQAKVSLAESALVNGTSGGGGTALAAAQAAVARDQAAVASDLVALKEAVLTAPTNGVIAFVGGTVGDLAGPTGISIGSTSGVQVPSSSGFSLFPPAPQAPSTSSQSGSAPMIAFYPAGAWEAVAAVPQASALAIHPGQLAQVTVDGSKTTLAARVVRIDSAPIYSNGAASYDVILTLGQQLSWGLVGMGADVGISSSH